MDCITVEVARSMPLSHILMLYYILIEQETQHISEKNSLILVLWFAMVFLETSTRMILFRNFIMKIGGL